MYWKQVKVSNKYPTDYRLNCEHGDWFHFVTVSGKRMRYDDITEDGFYNLYYSSDGQDSILFRENISVDDVKGYLDLAEEAWCTDDLENVWREHG